MNLESLQRRPYVLVIAAVALLGVIGVAGLAIGFSIGWFFGEPETPAGDAIVQAAQPAADNQDEQQAEAAEDAEDQWYTCSMHPQVRTQDPSEKCPICFMDLIPVTEDAAGERQLVMTQAAIKLAEIQTSEATRFFPLREVRMYGAVDYDETRLAKITAYFPGRLERLFVDYTGVPVKAGEHLAEIYSPELISAQEELRLALQAVQSATGGSDIVRRSTERTLQAARDKLRLWGLTDAQIRDLEQREETLERMTIYSPMAGVVIHKKAVEGMYVRTGEEIYTVADLDHLWVKLEAYESQMPWIRFGQSVTFNTDSAPGERFEGRISFIDPVVDPATRTVDVRVNIDNHDRRLKPGMFVRAVARSKIAGEATLIADELAGKWISPMHPEVIKDGPGQCDICGMDLVPVESLGYVPESSVDGPPLVIPASAPLITGTRAVVYVRVPDTEKPTFEGREVVLGPRAGAYYIVKEGLAEGEDVVVNGAFKIDSAMQIAAKPSMMNPPESEKPAETSDRFEAPVAFIQMLKPVFSTYFDAQEALAADDLEAFRRAVTDLHAAVNLAQPVGMTGEPLAVWRRLSDQLLTNAGHVEHIADLEQARALFRTYSDAILSLEERFGHRGAHPYYRQFCPMAFDNVGAPWLAREEAIRNPYFGASMLTCGETQHTFTPLDAQEANQ